MYFGAQASSAECCLMAFSVELGVVRRVIRVVELFLLVTVASLTSTACTDLITVSLNDLSA